MHQLIVGIVTCKRSAKNHACQNSSIDRGGSLSASSLLEKLLAIDGFWR